MQRARFVNIVNAVNVRIVTNDVVSNTSYSSSSSDDEDEPPRRPNKSRNNFYVNGHLIPHTGPGVNIINVDSPAEEPSVTHFEGANSTITISNGKTTMIIK